MAARGGSWSKLSRRQKQLRSAAAWAWPNGGSGPGGSGPAWVPTGAIAAIDFVNDPPRAWTATDGETTDMSTVLGDSALLNQTFDPDGFEAGVGYTGQGAFIGAMVDAFAFDFTVKVEHQESLLLEFAEATFGTDILYNYGTGSAPGLSDSSTGFSLRTRDEIGTGINGTVGAHVSAFSISADLMYGGVDSVAFNDGDTDTGPHTTADPATPNNPTDIIFSCSVPMQFLTVYPLKNEADTLALTA